MDETYYVTAYTNLTGISNIFHDASAEAKFKADEEFFIEIRIPISGIQGFIEDEKIVI